MIRINIKYIFSIIAFIFFNVFCFSQTQPRQLKAIRITTPPKINGILDEVIWKDVPVASNFIQYDPINGQPSNFKTEVHVTYDDNALYIGAYLYDTLPAGIFAQFGERDDGNLNADYFSFNINPFCDGQNALIFAVSASGIQVDARVTADVSNEQWDAVWQSGVNINKNGWSVEFKIPWSALRFPANSDKDWDINFWRTQRSTRETSSWNPVDNSNEEMANQMGKLSGIKNIDVPIRLSFMPYVSFYLNNFPHNTPGVKNTTTSYNAGMDLKYGLNESFTLDMTLIPDFGQVQSDEVVLNLTPFEIKYDENRQFFNEGTELFTRADLFYSRRIGSTPINYYNIFNNLDSTQKIIENPNSTQMINATKISGRTKNGTGLGFFNAITSNTYAKISNADNSENKILTQPLTNYNIVVYDKPFLKNSYASFINTNVYYDSYGNMANVSGTEFKLADKRNRWAFMGLGAVSMKFDSSNTTAEPGHKYAIGFGKISGNFKFGISNSQLSDTYDPNDLGYIEYNNDMINDVDISYHIYNPFWKLLNIHNMLTIIQKYRYAPRTQTDFSINYDMVGTFKDHTTVMCNAYYQPFEMYDYYEPRAEGRYLKRTSNWYIAPMFSTDYRKRLACDGQVGYLNAKGGFKDSFWWMLSPRFRVSDRFLIIHEFTHDNEWHDIGFVEADSIIHMGQRDNRRIENTLNLNYSFSKDILLSLKIRHYWITVKYNQLFALQDDGSILPEKVLTTNDYEKYNENFNAFNVDMVFNWQFAPGSSLSMVWKNAIINSDDETKINFIDNFSNTITSDQLNSFSIKLLYYLDYMYLQKKK
ncbi:MAG TPA: DUF5916 domain-containing protein [Bacteroidales bacterium]|nr:DUF5916 domain-containing protein [Bacteroidales bacterium]HPS17498.1 DUF5916 domain-containing protein [Bacteroidales bacterium]